MRASPPPCESGRMTATPAPAGPFGLNRATVAALVTIGGLGLSEHLWRGFLGPYLSTVTGGLGPAACGVAAFSAVLSLLEAPAYIVGGSAAHRWGPRITLAIGALPLVAGFTVFAISQSPVAVVLEIGRAHV